MEEAFHKLRSSLSNVSSLCVPHAMDCLVLHTDASGAGIGATLHVIREGTEIPVAFYAKQLQGAKKNYSTTELEGLAIFKAIFQFCHFHYGRELQL